MKYSTIVNIVMLWVVRIPSAWLIGHFIDGKYIMACFPISFTFGMLCMLAYFFTEKWKKSGVWLHPHKGLLKKIIRNSAEKTDDYLMGKQINDTLVIGMILVLKQACFCLANYFGKRCVKCRKKG